MEITPTIKEIVVLYHGFCTDGFGSAYAAWKKFGDDASYLAMDRNEPLIPKELLADKEVYVLDYSFSLEVMESYQSVAKSFTVIDHHRSSEQDVKQLHSFVFDNEHSGAYLSWQYFHPEIEVPTLIKYISDSDTWTHTLSDWEVIESYIYSNGELHFTFDHFTSLHHELETIEGYEYAKKVGKLLLDINKTKILMYLDKAEKVFFEGHEIYVVSAPREVRNEVGNILAQKTNSFSIVFNYENKIWKCSLRSVKDFDVSLIAKVRGGGGHKNASAFIIPTEFPIQFTHSTSRGQSGIL